MPGKNSSHWDVILDALADGPIEDRSGLATQKLVAETGHSSTNALTKLLARMEAEGLIERDIAGRRTTRISLTAAGRRQVRRVSPARVAEAPAPSTNGDGGVDYDLLAAALLAKALKAQQAQEQSAGAKDAVARAERAEAARRIAEADAQAARAKVADLEAQVRILEQNLALIQAQLDKAPQRGSDTIRERLSAQERRELDALMRALPTARG